MSVCLAVIVTVCIHHANSIALHETDATASAEVAFADGTMTVDIPTELTPALDRSRMAKTCDGEVCIAYYKRCAESRQAYSCTYAATEVTRPKDVVFRITAASKGKLRAIEDSIGIVARAFNEEAEFSPAAFERSAFSNAPPVCGEAKARC